MTGLAVDYNVPMKMTDDMGEKKRGKAYYDKWYRIKNVLELSRKNKESYLLHKDSISSKQKDYYLKNAEKIKERNKAWVIKNKDRKKEADKEWVKTHSLQVRASKIKWKEKNIESVRAKGRAYASSHKEEQKMWNNANQPRVRASRIKWRQTNPEKARFSTRMAKLIRRGAGGHHSAKKDKELLFAQQGNCYYCGFSMGEHPHLEHMIPIIRGGSNDSINLCFSCPSCNFKKHTTKAEDFIKERRFSSNKAREEVDKLHAKWYNESAKTAQGE